MSTETEIASARAVRLTEAQAVLRDLGFGRAQTNDRSAWTLLALLQLEPETLWADAQNPMLGTFAIMGWVSDRYGRTYAPNSRETFRRQTLHQFIEAGLVIYNEDEPGRLTNSSLNNYKMNPDALALVRTYGTDAYRQLLIEYLDIAPGLTVKYAATREMTRIPVTLPNGEEVIIAGGGQNDLIKKMVEEFCPRFAPGGQVLYIGDADAKLAVFHEKEIAALGVTIDHHGKLPDLVVYLKDKNWLTLMEAASTHGPVDAKRYGELKTLFAGSTAGLVYVSAFPDRATMRKFLADLSWETEVWNAAEPTHLMHLNGMRFLGPYDS